MKPLPALFRIYLASLFQGAQPPAMLSDVRANVLLATDRSPGRHPFPGFLRRFALLFHLHEEAADGVLSRMTDPEAWLELGGVSLHHFEPGPVACVAHAGLLRCAPGLPFPVHRHVGQETTLFLSGTVRDEADGTLFLPGDLVSMPAESRHHLTVLTPYECVFAVLMEGGFPEFELD